MRGIAFLLFVYFYFRVPNASGCLGLGLRFANSVNGFEAFTYQHHRMEETREQRTKCFTLIIISLFIWCY